MLTCELQVKDEEQNTLFSHYPINFANISIEAGVYLNSIMTSISFI